MSDDLVARLRRAHHHRPIPDEPSLYGEAAARIEALAAERDTLSEMACRLADWVRQYEGERDAARLGAAAADLSLMASIRQAMFDEAESVLTQLRGGQNDE